MDKVLRLDQASVFSVNRFLISEEEKGGAQISDTSDDSEYDPDANPFLDWLRKVIIFTHINQKANYQVVFNHPFDNFRCIVRCSSLG